MFKYQPEGLLIDSMENKKAVSSLAALSEAMQQKKILEARAVICDAQHNLIVDLGCCKGIIPRMEGALGVSEGSTRDIAIISRVGKAVCFQITELTEDEQQNPVALLSRRAVQELCCSNYIANLMPGDIIPARVTHLEPFGCFVDIGCGISSLIPIDSISVSRISHPSDRFRVGQDIRAVVKAVDETGRVFLTHKELLGTWEENAALFSPGETVAGIIRSVEDYGAFVELTPNLAGLAEPREGIHPGQYASVYIKSLIPNRMKVKLIIVDAFDAEYDALEPEYFYTGDHMQEWRYSPDSSEKIIESRFE